MPTTQDWIDFFTSTTKNNDLFVLKNTSNPTILMEDSASPADYLNNCFHSVSPGKSETIVVLQDSTAPHLLIFRAQGTAAGATPRSLTPEESRAMAPHIAYMIQVYLSTPQYNYAPAVCTHPADVDLTTELKGALAEAEAGSMMEVDDNTLPNNTPKYSSVNNLNNNGMFANNATLLNNGNNTTINNLTNDNDNSISDTSSNDDPNLLNNPAALSDTIAFVGNIAASVRSAAQGLFGALAGATTSNNTNNNANNINNDDDITKLEDDDETASTASATSSASTASRSIATYASSSLKAKSLTAFNQPASNAATNPNVINWINNTRTNTNNSSTAPLANQSNFDTDNTSDDDNASNDGNFVDAATGQVEQPNNQNNTANNANLGATAFEQESNQELDDKNNNQGSAEISSVASSADTVVTVVHVATPQATTEAAGATSQATSTPPNNSTTSNANISNNALDAQASTSNSNNTVANSAAPPVVASSSAGSSAAATAIATTPAAPTALNNTSNAAPAVASAAPQAATNSQAAPAPFTAPGSSNTNSNANTSNNASGAQAPTSDSDNTVANSAAPPVVASSSAGSSAAATAIATTPAAPTALNNTSSAVPAVASAAPQAATNSQAAPASNALSSAAPLSASSVPPTTSVALTSNAAPPSVAPSSAGQPVTKNDINDDLDLAFVKRAGAENNSFIIRAGSIVLDEENTDGSHGAEVPAASSSTTTNSDTIEPRSVRLFSWFSNFTSSTSNNNHASAASDPVDESNTKNSYDTWRNFFSRPTHKTSRTAAMIPLADVQPTTHTPSGTTSAVSSSNTASQSHNVFAPTAAVPPASSQAAPTSATQEERASASKECQTIFETLEKDDHVQLAQQIEQLEKKLATLESVPENNRTPKEKTIITQANTVIKLVSLYNLAKPIAADATDEVKKLRKDGLGMISEYFSIYKQIEDYQPPAHLRDPEFLQKNPTLIPANPPQEALRFIGLFETTCHRFNGMRAMQSETLGGMLSSATLVFGSEPTKSAAPAATLSATESATLSDTSKEVTQAIVGMLNKSIHNNAEIDISALQTEFNKLSNDEKGKHFLILPLAALEKIQKIAGNTVAKSYLQCLAIVLPSIFKNPPHLPTNPQQMLNLMGKYTNSKLFEINQQVTRIQQTVQREAPSSTDATEGVSAKKFQEKGFTEDFIIKTLSELQKLSNIVKALTSIEEKISANMLHAPIKNTGALEQAIEGLNEQDLLPEYQSILTQAQTAIRIKKDHNASDLRNVYVILKNHIREHEEKYGAITAEDHPLLPAAQLLKEIETESSLDEKATAKKLATAYNTINAATPQVIYGFTSERSKRLQSFSNSFPKEDTQAVVAPRMPENEAAVKTIEDKIDEFTAPELLNLFDLLTRNAPDSKLSESVQTASKKDNAAQEIELAILTELDAKLDTLNLNADQKEWMKRTIETLQRSQKSQKSPPSDTNSAITIKYTQLYSKLQPPTSVASSSTKLPRGSMSSAASSSSSSSSNSNPNANALQQQLQQQTVNLRNNGTTADDPDKTNKQKLRH